MSILKTQGMALPLLVLAVLFSACEGGSFKVNTNFSNTQDIREGTLVYFEDSVVGKVSDVESLGNGTQVELSLDRAAAASIGSSSAVVVNRLKEGAPLEIYNRNTPDMAMLENGQTLQGLDSMFQLAAWMVGDVIQVGSGTLSDYVDSFQQYLQSEEFQQDKQQVQQQLNSATTAAQKALREVEQDIAAAADELTASEGAAAQAVAELGDELAPVVEELARSGAQLAEQLEKFAEGLAQAEPSEQQAGEQFMASLLAMLEKLNQGIERGIEERELQSQEKD